MASKPSATACAALIAALLHAPPVQAQDFASDSLAVRELLDTNGLRDIPVARVASGSPRITSLILSTMEDPLPSKAPIIPASLGRLTALKSLSLVNQGIPGLPPEIGGLAELEDLDLTANALTGFPTPILKLSRLRYLSLASNSIPALPDSMNILQALEILDVGHNPLPSLPPALALLPKLRELNARNCGISELPAGLVSYGRWNHLQLDGNQLCRLPLAMRRWLNTYAPLWAESQACPDGGGPPIGIYLDNFVRGGMLPWDSALTLRLGRELSSTVRAQAGWDGQTHPFDLERLSRWPGTFYRGFLSGSGLPAGRRQVDITIFPTPSETSSVRADFVFLRKPALEIGPAVQYSPAAPKATLEAACKVESARTCRVSIGLVRIGPRGPLPHGPVREAAGSLRFEFDLGEVRGSILRINYRAVDDLGFEEKATRSVDVQSGLPPDTGDTLALDFAPIRIGNAWVYTGTGLDSSCAYLDMKNCWDIAFRFRAVVTVGDTIRREGALFHPIRFRDSSFERLDRFSGKSLPDTVREFLYHYSEVSGRFVPDGVATTWLDRLGFSFIRARPVSRLHAATLGMDTVIAVRDSAPLPSAPKPGPEETSSSIKVKDIGTVQSHYRYELKGYPDNRWKEVWNVRLVEFNGRDIGPVATRRWEPRNGVDRKAPLKPRSGSRMLFRDAAGLGRDARGRLDAPARPRK